MVIFFCLYYYVITVTHPKILTTSQTPQGQPKGSAHVEGGASSTSQRGHTATCCTTPWDMLNAGEERDAGKPGMGLSRLILLHSNKTSCNSWHYQLTTGSCHLPLLNKLDHRSTSSTSKPPACPTRRTLQKHQSLSAYHQFTPKTSKYFSQIASFHEVFLLKTYI